MSIDADFAKRSYPERIPTNNKIDLENGDYEIHIHDVWVRYVDIDKKYVKNKANASGQRIKFTITLDGTQPPIALEHDLPVTVSKNSLYSKTLEQITGITDRDKHLTFDPKTLVNWAGIATIKCEEKVRKDPPHDPYPWVSITALRPRIAVIKKPTPVRPAALAVEENDDDHVPFPDDEDYARR